MSPILWPPGTRPPSAKTLKRHTKEDQEAEFKLYRVERTVHTYALAESKAHAEGMVDQLGWEDIEECEVVATPAQMRHASKRLSVIYYDPNHGTFVDTLSEAKKALGI